MALTKVDDVQLDTEVSLIDALVGQTAKLNPTGGRVLLVVGSGPGVALSRELKDAMPFDTSTFPEVATKTAEQIASIALYSQPDVVVGIGGGAVIDRGKVAAKTAKASYLAVPTALSQDGLYTENAVLRSPSGRVERFKCRPPESVIPAVEIIESAPNMLRAACVGDLLSNINAVEDCYLAEQEGKYSVSSEATKLALEAARLGAASDPDGSPMELFEPIKLSGKAMMLAAGSRPCSGAEHKIDSALNLVASGTRSHGLTVSFATAFLLALRGYEQLDETLQIMRLHGLPTEPAGIGVAEDTFVEAVKVACGLRPSRYTILDHSPPSKDQTIAVLRELQA